MDNTSTKTNNTTTTTTATATHLVLRPVQAYEGRIVLARGRSGQAILGSTAATAADPARLPLGTRLAPPATWRTSAVAASTVAASTITATSSTVAAVVTAVVTAASAATITVTITTVSGIVTVALRVSSGRGGSAGGFPPRPPNGSGGGGGGPGGVPHLAYVQENLVEELFGARLRRETGKRRIDGGVERDVMRC